MAAPTLHPFAIDVDALGNGSVQVDGNEVSSRIAGATVTVAPGQPTRLTLYTDRPGAVVGEGIVEVQPLGGGAGDAVRALDVEAVRARVQQATLYDSAADDTLTATLAVVATMLTEAEA